MPDPNTRAPKSKASTAGAGTLGGLAGGALTGVIYQFMGADAATNLAPFATLLGALGSIYLQSVLADRADG